MKHSLDLASVRIVAAGEIRPLMRRVQVTATQRDELQAWCSFFNVSSSDEIEHTHYGNGRLHCGELVERWREIKGYDPARSLTLVYVFRGHQADTKTPILQHLLELLDHRGNVYAFRAEAKSALNDAVAFAVAALPNVGDTLIVYDPTLRLAKAGEPAAPLHYLLLSPANRDVPVEAFHIGESTMELFFFQSDQ